MEDRSEDVPVGGAESTGQQVLEIVESFKSGPFKKAKDDFEPIREELSREAGEAPATLRVEAPRLESHVRRALETARSLAGDRPIDARLALLGALVVTRESGGKSKAFGRIAQLCKLAELPDRPEDVRGSGLNSFRLSTGLARSFHRALGEDPSPSIWGRDYVAAALLAVDDPSLRALAGEAQATVAELQDSWFHFVAVKDTRHRDRAAWEGWWRDAGVPLPEQRSIRAGYLPESTVGRDRIGIDKEVHAFARVIADAQTEPPLSIGLLGDWGSGKSFFMKRLESEVQALEGQGPELCRYIVQISFNSWHYSDSNLWPSLVGHIFEKIWEHVSSEETPAESRRTLQEGIEQARGALFEAEAQVDDAQRALASTEKRREELVNSLTIEKFVDETARNALRKAAKAVGWRKPLRAIVELEEALESLEASGRGIKSLVDGALRGSSLRAALPWVAGSVAVAVVVLFLATEAEEHLKPVLELVGVLGGTVASVVSAIVAPLAKTGSQLRRFQASLQETVDGYHSTRDEVARDKQHADHSIAVEHERALREVGQTEARARALRERIVDLEKRHATLDPIRRLVSFLEERAQTEDYRSQQGIISLVRRDLHELSARMKDWTEEGGTPPEGLKPIDRIVLYIDDLDRCPPGQVVQTLEAIHLLLALDLFIVVAAVDSRWLQRSLEVHYKDLLTGESDVDRRYRVSTPQNYLEKIFQITFALAPISKEGFADYMDFLTARTERAREGAEDEAHEALPEAGQPEEASETATAGESEASPPEGDKADEPTPSTREEEEARDPESEAGDAPPDPTRPLVIHKAERDFLKRLHPLVPTPRLAKRLVNVYRLVKARVPRGEIEDFEAEKTGRHRPVLLLFAILFGCPELSAAIFRELCENDLSGGAGKRSAKGAESLHAALRKLAQQESAGQEEATTDSSALELLADLVEEIAADVTLAECEQEALELARYSLITGQDWHTWRLLKKDPAENEASSS
jgi:hypothetical protein